MLCEDAAQVAKVEEERGSLPRLRHVLTFDDLPGLEAEGAIFKAEHPSALDDAVAAIARGRPVHVHLHVGHDRPTEGLHDLPPQLLRDGVGDRPPAGLRARRRPDAAVPPARPQLRPADASDRPLRRLRDRLPAGSAPDGGRARDGAPNRAPERSARVREDPHGRRRRDRRDDRRQAPARRLGARGRSRGRQARGGRPARRRHAAPEAPGRRQARLPQDPRRASAGGCGRRSRAARRSSRRSPSSSTRSGSGSSRATGSRNARPPRRRTRPSAGGSGRSARRCPASSCASPTTASS